MMATGYVHDVADGKITTLRDFALRCARGMGATIMMRDEPWDAPIPERFEPNTKYEDERIAASRALLAEAHGWSDDECERRASEEHAKAVAERERYEAEQDVEYARVAEMIALVKGWEPKAEGIKSFMLEQLERSYGNGPYRMPEPEKLSGGDWRRKALEKASRDLGQSETRRAEEIVRTEERNRWLADLRASLPDPVTA